MQHNPDVEASMVKGPSDNIALGQGSACPDKAMEIRGRSHEVPQPRTH